VLQTVAWSVGLVFQLVGVFIALVGVLSNQRQYKKPGEPWMLDWVFTVGHWIGRLAQKSRDWVMRVIFRKEVTHSVRIRVGAVNFSGTAMLSATAQVGHNPLDENLPVDEKLRILDARSRQDNATINRLETEALADHKRIDNLSAELENRTAEVKAHSAESLRAYATRGVKASAWGLFITALGMLISAFAQPPWIA
jgi:hypothetical protein